MPPLKKTIQLRCISLNQESRNRHSALRDAYAIAQATLHHLLLDSITELQPSHPQERTHAHMQALTNALKHCTKQKRITQQARHTLTHVVCPSCKGATLETVFVAATHTHTITGRNHIASTQCGKHRKKRNCKSQHERQQCDTATQMEPTSTSG